VLLLAFAAVGLPVNEFSVYALLLMLTVIVFTGEIRSHARAWLAVIRHRRTRRANLVGATAHR
jgi:hypothetical protein